MAVAPDRAPTRIHQRMDPWVAGQPEALKDVMKTMAQQPADASPAPAMT